jgi:hypothetical protein
MRPPSPKGVHSVTVNYSDALTKLEQLHAIAKRLKDRSVASPPELYTDFAILYGELGDIIERFVPKQQIQTLGAFGGKVTYDNLIAAGFLSGTGAHELEGYMQLSSLLGRVRQLAADPIAPRREQSISAVAESLRRFRECCQYIRDVPESEVAVQDIIWIMLRSQFDRVDREDTLPRFGTRNYRPDFGIPELRLLIEAKFIGAKTSPADIQESIIADVPGYLSDAGRYDSIIVFVYDYGQKLRDARKFIEDLRSIEGIVDVLVIPGVGAKTT